VRVCVCVATVLPLFFFFSVESAAIGRSLGVPAGVWELRARVSFLQSLNDLLAAPVPLANLSRPARRSILSRHLRDPHVRTLFFFAVKVETHAHASDSESSAFRATVRRLLLPGSACLHRSLSLCVSVACCSVVDPCVCVCFN